jgi:hypothetical protein
MDNIFGTYGPIDAMQVVYNTVIPTQDLCDALKQSYERTPKYLPLAVIKVPGPRPPGHLPPGVKLPPQDERRPTREDERMARAEIDVQVELNFAAMELLETAVRFGCLWAIEEQARIRKSISGEQ